MEDQLIKQKVPINAKIKKNNFVLLGNADTKAKEYGKDLKIKSTVITKIWAALSHRDKESERLFKSKLFGLAQIISETTTTLKITVTATFR